MYTKLDFLQLHYALFLRYWIKIKKNVTSLFNKFPEDRTFFSFFNPYPLYLQGLAQAKKQKVHHKHSSNVCIEKQRGTPSLSP